MISLRNVGSYTNIYERTKTETKLRGLSTPGNNTDRETATLVNEFSANVCG
jgi:hypothetical protein